MGKGSRSVQNNKEIVEDVKAWVQVYASMLIAELPFKIYKLGYQYYAIDFYNTANEVCKTFVLGPRNEI